VTAPVGPDPDRWDRLLPFLWSAALALLLTGPALAPGFVLSYDMVWVPDLVLGPDALGLGSGLPRAVPSDVVVAVLDEVVPGMLLQKLVLLGCVVAGGVGSSRLIGLVRGDGVGRGAALAGSLVAAGVAVWNPWTVERWWLGHWPLLVGAAVLPWLVAAADRWRRTGRGAGAVLVLLLSGSLSASAGIASALAAAVVAGRRPRGRPDVGHDGRVAAVVLVAQLPWLVSGLAHADIATTREAGVFALDGEGGLGRVLTALSLGGVWNAEVVPASRDGVLAVVWLAFLAVTVSLGLASWWRTGRSGLVARLLLLAAAGLVLALAPALAPAAFGAVTSAVPGAGLLRDSSRSLVLCLPGVAVLTGLGAGRLVSAAPTPLPAGVLAVGLVLVPVAVLPDAAWGLGGAWRPVAYPADYAEARTTLDASREGTAAAGSTVLVLPLESYRAPGWNGGRKVLSPAGRYLTGDALTSDVLLVDGIRVGGEDPRVAAAGRALADPDPGRVSARLAELGVGWVATEGGAPYPGDGAEVAGGADLGLVRLAGSEGVSSRAWEVSGPARLAVLAAWWAWAAGWLVGLALLAGHVMSGFRRARW
jgi:hypothetical protein